MAVEELKDKKDEMKDRISMALKDPILQQGFEIICKNLSKLEEENKDIQQSCENYYNEMRSYKNKVTKAKEIIKELKAWYIYPIVTKDDLKRQEETLAEVEQFLSEVEK